MKHHFFFGGGDFTDFDRLGEHGDFTHEQWGCESTEINQLTVEPATHWGTLWGS